MESKFRLRIRKEHKNYIAYEHEWTKNRGFHVNKKKVQRLIRKLWDRSPFHTHVNHVAIIYRGKIEKRRKPDSPSFLFIFVIKITTDTTEFKVFRNRISKAWSGQRKVMPRPVQVTCIISILSYRISEKPNAFGNYGSMKKPSTDHGWLPLSSHLPFGSCCWVYQMPVLSAKTKETENLSKYVSKGNCLDNLPVENFFSSSKQEIFMGKLSQFWWTKTMIDDYIYYCQ